MTAASGIAQLVARWAHIYADKKAVSAGVTYVHLAGILLGGGIAVGADRTSLQLRRADPDVMRELERLRSAHRVVLSGIAIIITSGLLILLSDLHTYITSALYWTKMGLVACLLINGYVRLRAETALAHGRDASWPTFRRTSILSLVLWFGILLAGAFLTTIA